MKTIFTHNNRKKVTLYILFAICFLLFAALFFISGFLPQDIFFLALILTLTGIMFFGSLIIATMGGPPW